MEWWRLVIRLPDASELEAAGAELWALNPAGSEIHDRETRPEIGDEVELVGYFRPDADPGALEGFRWPGATSVALDRIAEEAWAEGYKQHFPPTRVSPRITVRPPWDEQLPPGPHEAVVVIDPGMAFGTGTHETTRLCLEAIDAVLKSRGRTGVLDVGCGSGILTIAAARLGAEPVSGLDNDPEVIPIAAENWERNGLGPAAGAPFRVGTLESETRRFGLVVANVLSRDLLAMRQELLRVLADGGDIVLSGILESEREAFSAAFGGKDLIPTVVRVRGEWVALEWTRSR